MNIRIAFAFLAVLSTGLHCVDSAAQSVSSEPDVCAPDNLRLCLNGVSTSVTNGAGLRNNVGGYTLQQNERVLNRIKDQSGSGNDNENTAVLGPQSGLAAGDLWGGWGAWLNYHRASYNSNFIFSNSLLAYDATSNRGTFGVDKLFASRFLLGLSVGYENTDTTTIYNGGGQDTDGFTIAPYAAWLINDYLSLDVSGGYSPLNYDQNRVSPADGTQILSSFDSDRWFVASNLNATVPVRNWILGGRVGVLYTEESQDGYVETGVSSLRTVADRNIDLTQIVVGADAAYAFGAFEPYALVIYRNDISRNNDESAGGLPGAFTIVQPDDDDEIEAGFGLRLYSSFGVTSSFEWSIVEGRESFRGQNISLTIRADL